MTFLFREKKIKAGFHILIEMFPFLSFSYLSVPAAPSLAIFIISCLSSLVSFSTFLPGGEQRKINKTKLDPKQILGWFNFLVFLVAGGSPAFDTVELVHAFVSCGICVRGEKYSTKVQVFTSTGL